MNKYLQMATEELYAAHQENQPTMAISRILRVIDDLIHHLESAPTPETQSSSSATAPTEDGQSGSNTCSETWRLVRADRFGDLPITVTATCRGFNLHEVLGLLRRDLQDAGWTQPSPMTLESPSLSGPALSTTPVAPQAGPSAGGGSGWHVFRSSLVGLDTAAPTSPSGAQWHVAERGEYDSYEWWLCNCTTGFHGEKRKHLDHDDLADYLNALEAQVTQLQQQLEEAKHLVDGALDAMRWVSENHPKNSIHATDWHDAAEDWLTALTAGTEEGAGE